MNIQAAARDSTDGRSRLLDAAAAEFADRGYAGASIAAIARRAGVSKSTVFHHFESKEDLYLTVISEAVNDFSKRIDAALAPDASAREALERFQIEHRRHLENHRQVACLILRELQNPAVERRKPLIIELLSVNFTRLVQFIEGAQADGRLSASSDAHVAALMMFAINAFKFQHAQELEHLPGAPFGGDDDQFTRSVVDIIYNGLAPSETHGDEQ